MTVFALLELYKRGEAAWEQDEPFGEITVRAETRGGRRHERSPPSLEALLFLAPDPVSVEELADALQTSRGGGGPGRRRSSRPTSTAADSCCAASPAASRSPRTRTPRRPRGGCSPARARPSLTPAQAETLAIVAYLQPVSRPEVARIRGVASESATSALVDRGLIEEAGRSQFGAVLYRTTPLFLKLFGLDSPEELPDVAQWDPSPRRPPTLRDRLLRAGEARGEAERRPLAFPDRRVLRRGHDAAGYVPLDGRLRAVKIVFALMVAVAWWPPSRTCSRSRCSTA